MDVSNLIVSIGASSLGTVHGVLVGEVSPIKTSRKRNNVKYFEGQCSDGKKTVRLVTFEPKVRGQLDEAQKAQCHHTDNHNFYAFFFPPLEMYPDLL